MHKLLIVLIALMMISCSTTPVTPRLKEPEKPTYPKFTAAEIKLLNDCAKDDKPTCEVQDETLRKIRNKDIMCRGYAEEAVTVIRVNNAQSK